VNAGTTGSSLGPSPIDVNLLENRVDKPHELRMTLGNGQAVRLVCYVAVEQLGGVRVLLQKSIQDGIVGQNAVDVSLL
jgi:hypothetical protein